MKKNEIRFTIRGEDDAIHGYSVEINNGKLLYFNKPLCCDCSEDEKSEFVYKDNEIICPKCGKKSESIYTYEDYRKDQMENLHLRLLGEDVISGLRLYKLNTTLDYDEWVKVEDLFVKLDSSDVDFGYYNPKIIGWVTTEPHEVEERLKHLIKPENRIKYETQKYSTKSYLKEKARKIIDEIYIEFSLTDPPEGKFILNGETIQNPLNPKNMYGGGEWFVITEDYIWMVVNNSRPGGNYKLNNIVTESAGAMGRRLKYNQILADKIRQLKEMEI